MSRPVARILCVVVVLLSLVSGTAPAGAAQTTQTIAGTQVTPDDVSLHIDVRENGSAEWTVEYRVRLDDENTTEAFESVRADIEANESAYAAQFRDRMNATAATAENATGREMAVRNVDVQASRSQLPQEYGVITYTFVWTEFAVVDDGTIRAGDALEGLFLDEETTLLFSWPEGYGFEAAEPTPDDRRTRTVVWDGPLDFGPGEPNLRVSESAGPTATAAAETPATGGAGSAPGDSDPDAGGSDPLSVLAGGVLLVAVAVGGVYLSRRRSDARSDEPDGSDAADATVSAGAGTAAGTSDAEPAAQATEANDAGAATSTATGDAAAEDEGPTASDDADPPWEDELLSNRERVLALIEHEGGRLKQQEVAKTLDWTDAKTSQVVRTMRDEDELDAFRLGRENVLVLPGESLESDGDDK